MSNTPSLFVTFIQDTVIFSNQMPVKMTVNHVPMHKQFQEELYMGNSTVADVTFRLSFETLIWHRQRINKELSSLPLMNMFVPTDILIELYNFSISLISVKEIEPKNTVAQVT